MLVAIDILRCALIDVRRGSVSLQCTAHGPTTEGQKRLSAVRCAKLQKALSALDVLLNPPVAPPKMPSSQAKRRSSPPKMPCPVNLRGLGTKLNALMPCAQDAPHDFNQEASACRALLLEIIRRAAYDWILYRGSSKIPNSIWASDAHSWLFLENGEGELTSFLSICTILELDPCSVRRHIRTMTVKDILGTGRPAEHRKNREALECIHGEDLPVFDVDVYALPIYDALYNAPQGPGG